MTLDQLAAMKAWHVAHRRQSPVEFHVCDAVLTLWLLGWTGVPAALLLDQPWALLGCLLGFLTPGRYLRLRRRLHLRQRLRCDWLDALPRPSR